MTKAEEFEALISITDRKCDHEVEEAWRWVTRHSELIARALQTQEMFDKADPEKDHAGFFWHEQRYCEDNLGPLYAIMPAQAIRRGFLEGWKALQRFIIQAPK